MARKPKKTVLSGGKRNFLPVYIALLFLILIGLWLYHKWPRQEEQIIYMPPRNQPTLAPSEDPTYYYITPTVAPIEENGWNRFEHPLHHFSFNYPSSLHLKLLQRRNSPDWYQIILSDNADNPSFHIHFQTGGRDYPPYEERTVEKTLGGRLTSWKTLYQDGQAIELMVGFPYNDFGDHLIGLYVYLPKTGQDEFIAQLEKIVASLE